MSAITSAFRRRWIIMIRQGETVLCGICGKPCKAKAVGKDRIKHGGLGAITVDHIIPQAWGGDDIASNLQPAHQLCNQRKGNKI